MRVETRCAWNPSGTRLEPVWNLSGTCLEPGWNLSKPQQQGLPSHCELCMMEAVPATLQGRLEHAWNPPGTRLIKSRTRREPVWKHDAPGTCLEHAWNPSGTRLEPVNHNTASCA